MAARKFSDQDYERIVELRERGHGYDFIAAQLSTPERKMSGKAVSWHCLRLGVEPPKPTKLWTGIVGPAVMRRGRHVLRRFTDADDALLLKLEAQGMNPCQIGRALDRKPNSIRGRLMTLARRDERLSAQAEPRALARLS